MINNNYNYQIAIRLKSDALIGSGEGFGSIIDTDVVFDDLGLPYIPAKRVKGIMLESAQELNEMLNIFNKSVNIDNIFGKKGEKEGLVYFSNFYLENYANIREWLEYYCKKTKIINKQSIIAQMTSLRYSTAIDSKTNLAKEGSLRTERIINSGKIFASDIYFPEKLEENIALICQNTRRIGTKRTRGLGEIEVLLLKNGQSINNIALKKLESEDYK
ncbi:MAG: RAMP superfamily CRISPR-associated protein [bacterium]